MDTAERRGKRGEDRAGIAANVTIVWGRKDRLLLPRQAEQAIEAFPNARLQWVEECGHYIAWDAPDEALRLIRQCIAQRNAPAGSDTTV